MYLSIAPTLELTQTVCRIQRYPPVEVGRGGVLRARVISTTLSTLAKWMFTELYAIKALELLELLVLNNRQSPMAPKQVIRRSQLDFDFFMAGTVDRDGLSQASY